MGETGETEGDYWTPWFRPVWSEELSYRCPGPVDVLWGYTPRQAAGEYLGGREEYLATGRPHGGYRYRPGPHILFSSSHIDGSPGLISRISHST